MNFKRLLHSDIGKIMISIILGLGLASLFRRVCDNRSCLAFQGPSLDKIKNKTFKFNKRCYTFSSEAESCNPTKKQVSFA